MKQTTNNNVHPYVIGDIVAVVFHYSMQFVNFYQVVGTTRTCIDCKPCQEIVVSDDGYGQNGRSIAGDMIEDGETTRFRNIKTDGTFLVRGSWWHTGHKWQGEEIDFYTD